ncbi:MAG: DUF3991 and toprim domain-containing protein [Firmicutes bacterium]|nr:DUF3991 and toprim domain-containing protein [Bacillota bacterium]
MPYIHPDLIGQVKQIDLLTYLQTYDPDELVSAGGGEYCTKTHDSLRISHGLWCWHSRDIGGKTALDYLIKVHGMSFMDAVQHLLGRSVLQPPVFSCPPKPPPKKVLCLPPAAPGNDRALAYLQSRGIDRAVLEHCVQAGRLYESADFHNCVFIGTDKVGVPRYAALRGTVGSFKGEASGSDKRYSFSLPAQGESEMLHLFESAIDALSYATVMQMHGRDYTQAHLLSLAGVFAPARNLTLRLPVSLARYLEDYPGIERIDLHLDNDLAGQAAEQNITDLLGDSFEVRNRSPPTGKDVNEYLCRRLGLTVNNLNRKENVR